MDDIELRWLARDRIGEHPWTIIPEIVLQYRKRRHLVNYSSIKITGEYTNEPVWMEWVDVPIHKQ